MAFTLPSDLPTNLVDGSSTVDAAFFNNLSGMGNAVKAALATWGFSTAAVAVNTSESTTSTTYVDLTTTTDSVTVPIGSSGKALVILSANIGGGGYAGAMAYAMSGSNTAAATDAKSLLFHNPAGGYNGSISAAFLETGLTPGFTTFKLKYKTTNGGYSQAFANRRITVIPFPATDGTHASASLNVNNLSAISVGMSGQGLNRPAFDSVGAGYKAGGGSGSWSHTLGSNAKALVVPVLCNAASGVTVNIDGTTPLTLLRTPVTITTGGTLYLYLFGLINPPTGAHTINVANASSYLVANSSAYTNVVGFGSPQSKTGAGTAATQTATTSNPGRVWFQAFGSIANAAATAYSQTERWNGWASGSTFPLNFGDAAASTIATDFATTNSNTNGWGGVAVELMPSVPTYSKPTWVGTGGGVTASNPGANWVDVVPPDANLALVWVSEMPSSQTNTCTVTLGGTSMVEVTGSPWTYDATAGYFRLRCFALANPATGPGKTVAVTSNVNNNFHAHSVYYGGAVTTNGAATFTRGGASTQTSLTLPSTASNHVYAQAFAYRPDDNNSTFTAYSPAIGWRAVHSNAVGYTQPLTVGDAVGNDGALTISATRNGSLSYGWGGVAVDLLPAAPTLPYSQPTWVGTGAGLGHAVGPSFSWVDTIPSDCNFALVWLSTMSDSLTSATVTVGGTAATPVTGNPFVFYSTNTSIHAYYVKNPPTGANKSVSIAYSGNNWVNATVVYYGGVTTVGSATTVLNGTGGQQPSLSVPTTASNHLYAQAFSFRAPAGGNTITAYNQNKRAEWPSVYYDNPLFVGDAMGNGGTLTFSGTRNETSYQWGGVAIDLSS